MKRITFITLLSVVIAAGWPISGVGAAEIEACRSCTAECIDEILRPLRSRGWLGMGLHSPSLGKAGQVVEIAKIYGDSPAAEAGLMKGDLILAIGDTDLPRWNDEKVSASLAEIAVGDRVQIAYSRDGKRHVVELTAAPASVEAQAEWLGRVLLNRSARLLPHR